MSHLSDDDLLDLVLREGEPDAAPEPHLDACAGCAARHAAVRAEQGLFRRSFSEPSSSPAPRSRVRWAAAAAALVVGALLGAGADRLLTGPRAPSIDLQARAEEVRRIADQVGTLREEPSARLEQEFPGVLERALRAYGDYLEARLDFVAPLDDEERAELRRAVGQLFVRSWDDGDVRAGQEFRASLRRLLSPEHYVAFEEFLARDRVEGRAGEIDVVSDALAQTLNLRQSEEVRVREALLTGYPCPELPLQALGQWPPDELVGDQALAGRVRAVLPSDYHRAYDGYLDRLRAGRGVAARAARSFMAGCQAR